MKDTLKSIATFSTKERAASAGFSTKKEAYFGTHKLPSGKYCFVYTVN